MARIDNGIADKVDGELSYMGLSPDSKFENVDYRKEGELLIFIFVLCFQMWNCCGWLELMINLVIRC